MTVLDWFVYPLLGIFLASGALRLSRMWWNWQTSPSNVIDGTVYPPANSPDWQMAAQMDNTVVLHNAGVLVSINSDENLRFMEIGGSEVKGPEVDVYVNEVFLEYRRRLAERHLSALPDSAVN